MLATPTANRPSPPVSSSGGIVLGLTATRSGLTFEQATVLHHVLLHSPVRELHHGDCTGGDADADAVADALGVFRVIHPPDNPALRAFCLGETPGPYQLGVVLPAKPYKERNRDIVNVCWCLLAFPATIREQTYGGTWTTVRYARACGVPLVLVRPDGAILPERTDARVLQLPRHRHVHPAPARPAAEGGQGPGAEGEPPGLPHAA